MTPANDPSGAASTVGRKGPGPVMTRARRGAAEAGPRSSRVGAAGTSVAGPSPEGSRAAVSAGDSLPKPQEFGSTARRRPNGRERDPVRRTSRRWRIGAAKIALHVAGRPKLALRIAPRATAGLQGAGGGSGPGAQGPRVVLRDGGGAVPACDPAATFLIREPVRPGRDVGRPMVRSAEVERSTGAKTVGLRDQRSRLPAP